MVVLKSLVALALIAAAAARGDAQQQPSRTVKRAANADTAKLPYNVAAPAATPAFIHPPEPVLLPLDSVATLIGATTASPTSVLGRAAGLLSSTLKTLGGGKNCLDSKANSATISSLFYYGGKDTTVNLCPSANIAVASPIYFYGANQTLTTLGSPTGSTRATLTVTAGSCALYIADAGNDASTLSHLIVNGNRALLGRDPSGLALIEMGGNSVGQTIHHVKAFEPRSWSAVHILEGYEGRCDRTTVRDNELGPAGHAPSGSQQFNPVRRRSMRSSVRRDVVPHFPGEWADGISHACKNSVVTGNTIIDATDAGIALFGAPGSRITGNTIISDQRSMFGAIAAADYDPWQGSFEGTVVSGNTITAKGSLIKVGIATGPATWYAGSGAERTIRGGDWSNNRFTSGATGYFSYGISVAGHDDATFVGNSFDKVNFGGVYSSSCFSGMPAMQPMVYNSARSSGNTLQSGFVDSDYVLAICVGPGPIKSTQSA